jgi:hypothetical protein
LERSGGQSEARAGALLCDYLAELIGAAIYKFQERWRAGGRREGLSHRGVLPWHSLVEELRLSQVSYYG